MFAIVGISNILTKSPKLIFFLALLLVRWCALKFVAVDALALLNSRVQALPLVLD